MKPKHLAETLSASIDAHAFSGVVSIRQHGAVLYERAAGYADRSNRVANTLDMRFGIASGTKFFTALATGKLIAEGNLSFDTKLSECVALNFPHYSPDITIRHLLTHTSGVPDYLDEEKIMDFENFALAKPCYELKGPRDYLDIFPNEPMKFARGARFSYSNGGYILLGVVIEAITGMRYQSYVEQVIFKAAGMNRSGFFALNQMPEQTAQGYIEGKEGEGWRTNIYVLPIVGASDGGAFTTVEDVAKLWRAFWAGEIVPKALVEIYASPFVKAEGEGEHTWCGHGLWLSERAPQQWEVAIEGGDAGVSFKSSVMRDHDLQVTVISNTSRGAWPILEDIETVLKR
jgi:CubicO group peptidase (beta-lactamase class C family)